MCSTLFLVYSYLGSIAKGNAWSSKVGFAGNLADQYLLLGFIVWILVDNKSATYLVVCAL